MAASGMVDERKKSLAGEGKNKEQSWYEWA
jgi:hypothetical protein